MRRSLHLEQLSVKFKLTLFCASILASFRQWRIDAGLSAHHPFSSGEGEWARQTVVVLSSATLFLHLPFRDPPTSDLQDHQDFMKTLKWSGQVDLNHRPPDPEPELETLSLWARLALFCVEHVWAGIRQQMDSDRTQVHGMNPYSETNSLGTLAVSDPTPFLRHFLS